MEDTVIFINYYNKYIYNVQYNTISACMCVPISVCVCVCVLTFVLVCVCTFVFIKPVQV